MLTLVSVQGVGGARALDPKGNSLRISSLAGQAGENRTGCPSVHAKGVDGRAREAQATTVTDGQSPGPATQRAPAPA